MKNSIYIILFQILFLNNVQAENLNIKSKNISLDKDTKVAKFEGDVIATDANNNIFKTELAEYSKEQKLLTSKGKTIIITSEGFKASGSNMTFDNLNINKWPSVLFMFRK